MIKVKFLRSHADKTRRRIIEAATELFAQQGFFGTSFTQIAKKAKVNRSLIVHHFENKEILWKTVNFFLFSHFYH